MNELIQEIKHTLVSSELCNQSGALIYSSIKTLKKGDIYFLGLNPGDFQTKNQQFWTILVL